MTRSRELEWVRKRAREVGACDAASLNPLGRWWQRGRRSGAGRGRRLQDRKRKFNHLYDLDWPIKKKIETIATQMYGASGVSFRPQAERDIEARAGWARSAPICMAKTPLSLSHDPALKGRPTGFRLPIQELRMLAGAGFLDCGLFRYSTHAGVAKEDRRGTYWDLDRRRARLWGCPKGSAASESGRIQNLDS